MTELAESPTNTQQAETGQSIDKSNAKPEKTLLERVQPHIEDRWLELGSCAISADRPAGENIRLEDEFERIELEIAKLDSLTNQEPIEWRDVTQWCADILREQSKDLLVVSYLTRACCDTGVLNGLLVGTWISLSIVKTHWEQCFPPKKRKKGRAAAFDWLVERTLPLFDKYAFSESDLPRLTLLGDLLAELDGLLVEYLADDAPSFAELQQIIRRQVSVMEMDKKQKEHKASEAAAKQATPSATARPTVTTAPSGSAATVSTYSGSISNDRDLLNCYRAAQDSLRIACDYVRSQNLANPEAYRMNRFLTWLGITQLPPATNAVTQMRPPPKEKLQHYQSCYETASAEDLIPDLENSLSKAPYWLDGHRYVHACLTRSNYVLAADAVVDGVKAFVEKYPDVVNYKFSDQTGFADEETKRWINLEVRSSSSSNSVNNSLPLAGDSGNEWESAYTEAMALFKEKKIQEAFALFKAGCQQSYSKRQLSFWRFNQARFCFETQQFELAIALLEALYKLLSETGVESWEPEVSAKVIELLLRAYKTRTDDEVPKERVAALHERLCQFDLATAYELSMN